MHAAIDAVRWAYESASSGRATMPARIHLDVAAFNGVALVMPAFVPPSPNGRFPASLAVKTVSVFPGNASKGLPAVMGGVLVLDPSSGAVIGLLDGAALTAIRTGAGCGVATALLSRPDSSVLGVFGAGVQAAAQIEAICAVRPIREVRIFDRTPANADRLAARISCCLASVAETAREALFEADIVCCATNSPSPLFDDADIRLGTHINTIGAYKPTTAEVPASTVVRSRVFVDSREASLHEAGDIVQPLQSGLITENHILGEIGELSLGKVVGRTDHDQVTLFKSVGMAVQDAVCAAFVLAEAERLGLGQVISWP